MINRVGDRGRGEVLRLLQQRKEREIEEREREREKKQKKTIDIKRNFEENLDNNLETKKNKEMRHILCSFEILQHFSIFFRIIIKIANKKFNGATNNLRVSDK